MPVSYHITTWNDILNLVRELSEKIKASGFKPDVIVGILRGGAVPAALLTDLLFVKEILALRIKLYKGIGKTAERPVIIQHLPPVIEGKKVLVVDDVADTGITLKTAVELVRFAGGSEVKTATLHLKPWSSFVPDYYVETTDSWIVYPWEYLEFIDEISKRLEAEELKGEEAEAAKKALEKVKELIQPLAQGISTSSNLQRGMT